MSPSQLRRYKSVTVLGILATDMALGLALYAQHLPVLWWALTLGLVTSLAISGNWLVLRSLRRSAAKAAPGSETGPPG